MKIIDENIHIPVDSEKIEYRKSLNCSHEVPTMDLILSSKTAMSAIVTVPVINPTFCQINVLRCFRPTSSMSFIVSGS